MADRMRETMVGTLGHFWTELGDVYDLDESRDGYVRLVDNNLFHVGTLRTRDFNSEFGSNRERLPRPEAIYAMTASTLIEIALGLEYWTKFHRELGRAWAQARKLRKKRFEPRGCGLHDLRHTFAVLQLSAGTHFMRRDFLDLGVPVTHCPPLRSLVRAIFTEHFGPRREHEVANL